MSRALEQFIERAGFPHGWSNLESSGRRMAEQAVQELDHQASVIRDLLAFWRSFDGPAFDEIQHPAMEAAKALAGFPPEVTPIVGTDPAHITPGPWAIDRAATGYVRAIESPKGAICYGTIAEADAALIAAAPDLLTIARQYASECAECGGTGYASHAGTQRCNDCADVWAVIDKATGGEPSPIVRADQWTPEELAAIARCKLEPIAFNRVRPIPPGLPDGVAVELLALLSELTDIEGPLPGTADWHRRAQEAVQRATRDMAKALAKAITPELCTTPARVSRWKCPLCGSPEVQIGLPAWHREYSCEGGPGAPPYIELEYVESDGEADIMWWHCEACGESDGGEPELDDEPSDSPRFPPGALSITED